MAGRIEFLLRLQRRVGCCCIIWYSVSWWRAGGHGSGRSWQWPVIALEFLRLYLRSSFSLLFSFRMLLVPFTVLSALDDLSFCDVKLIGCRGVFWCRVGWRWHWPAIALYDLFAFLPFPRLFSILLPLFSSRSYALVPSYFALYSPCLPVLLS